MDTHDLAVGALALSSVTAAIAAVSLVFVGGQLKIMRAEHKHLLEDLARHADLAVTVRVVGSDDLVMRGRAARLGIGIDNSGTKAAGDTHINVIGPR